MALFLLYMKVARLYQKQQFSFLLWKELREELCQNLIIKVLSSCKSQGT